jgi:hypothetical protein
MTGKLVKKRLSIIGKEHEALPLEGGGKGWGWKTTEMPFDPSPWPSPEGKLISIEREENI